MDGFMEWVQKRTDQRTPGIGLGGCDQGFIDRTGRRVRLLLFGGLLSMAGDVRRIIVGLSAEAVVPLGQNNGQTTRVEEVL